MPAGFLQLSLFENGLLLCHQPETLDFSKFKHFVVIFEFYLPFGSALVYLQLPLWNSRCPSWIPSWCRMSVSVISLFQNFSGNKYFMTSKYPETTHRSLNLFAVFHFVCIAVFLICQLIQVFMHPRRGV